MINALDNNDVLADSLLDCKRFYGNYFACDELFSATEDVIKEQ